MAKLSDFKVTILFKVDGHEPVEVADIEVPLIYGSVEYTGHGTYYREIVVDKGELGRRLREVSGEMADELERGDHPDE